MSDELKMTLRRKTFATGDRVRLRGDMGGFPMTVCRVHNDWYCEGIDAMGGKHHVNMAFLERNERRNERE